MTEFKWIVLAGGFTGDGSREHQLFRNDAGDRVLVFNSREAAERHVVDHCAGYALIANVVAEATPAIELTYSDGRRMVACGR
jgi:hypothetical protein